MYNLMYAANIQFFFYMKKKKTKKILFGVKKYIDLSISVNSIQVSR